MIYENEMKKIQDIEKEITLLFPKNKNRAYSYIRRNNFIIFRKKIKKRMYTFVSKADYLKVITHYKKEKEKENKLKKEEKNLKETWNKISEFAKTMHIQFSDIPDFELDFFLERAGLTAQELYDIAPEYVRKRIITLKAKDLSL